jgi:predicted transcriptional regulator
LIFKITKKILVLKYIIIKITDPKKRGRLDLMATQTGNIRIDPELLNKISQIAKKENTTENKIINDILKKMVETTEKEPINDKIKRLALNTERVNQNKKHKKTSINELIGMFETEKPINPVEARKRIDNITRIH